MCIVRPHAARVPTRVRREIPEVARTRGHTYVPLSCRCTLAKVIGHAKTCLVLAGGFLLFPPKEVCAHVIVIVRVRVYVYVVK